MNQPVNHDKLLAQAVDVYEFRAAVPGDIDAIIGLYADFFAEINYGERGLVFDPKRAWAWVFNGISTGSAPHLLAIVKSNRQLVGSICYVMNHSFTVEPFASLNKFYVRKNYRRSAIGRVLATLALEVARADGAVSFDVGPSSGLEREMASTGNLFRKLGFDEVVGSKIFTRRL